MLKKNDWERKRKTSVNSNKRLSNKDLFPLVSRKADPNHSFLVFGKKEDFDLTYNPIRVDNAS